MRLFLLVVAADPPQLLQVFTPYNLAEWTGKNRLTRIENLIDWGADVTTSFDHQVSQGWILPNKKKVVDFVSVGVVSLYFVSG